MAKKRKPRKSSKPTVINGKTIYEPTQEQIRAECLKIQEEAGFNHAERRMMSPKDVDKTSSEFNRRRR